MTQAADTKPRRMAVVGMFDGLHLGHRYLLDQLKQEAASRGLQPAVITFTDHPLRVIAPDRAPQLLTDSGEKHRLLTDCGIPSADVIFIPFSDTIRKLSAADFLRAIHDIYGVDALLMGFNNRFGSDRDLSPEYYTRLGREAGVEVIHGKPYAIDYKESAEGQSRRLEVSSSAIRRALSEGDVALAAAMLGRPYTITGEVEHGRRMGRKIGFPTANLRIADKRLMLPADGVYYCTAEVDHETYPAIVNVGTRPTVDDSPRRTVEAHLITGEGEELGSLYGLSMTLGFVARLRDIRRFDSVEALAAQLAADRAEALRLHDF